MFTQNLLDTLLDSYCQMASLIGLLHAAAKLIYVHNYCWSGMLPFVATHAQYV